MAGDPTDPRDTKLIELETLFGADFVNLPTDLDETLRLRIEQGLYKIFDIEARDFDSLTAGEDPAFDSFEAYTIQAESQAPYRALAHLLFALTKRPPPDHEHGGEGGEESPD